MLITQKITLDLMRSGVPPVVNVMQADTNTRTVEASLYVGGVPFSLAADEDVTISVAYKKPDGTGGWYDVLPDGSTAATIAGNVVTAKLAPQVLSVPGTVCATLRIENIGETHRVSTFPFVIQVDADPGSNATVSENYYTVQNWDDVNRNIDELWAAVNSGAGGGEAVPGGYYLPSVTQPNASKMKVSYAASQPGMPSVSPVSVNLPAGPKGDPGLTPHIGANGNWWIGTTDTGVSAGGGSGGGTVSNAVLYTAQTLTDGQKKQARDNIGAIAEGHNFGIVNIVNNANNSILWLTSDGTKAQPVLGVADSMFQNVIFRGIAPGTDDTDAVNKAQLDAAIAGVSGGGGSGGASALIVTVDGDFSNYTVQYIDEHLYNGGVAYLYDAENGCHLPLSIVNESAFASYLDDEGLWHTYEIYNENSVTKSVYSYVAQEQLGDIETALDRIIEIQNSLIGGGA